MLAFLHTAQVHVATFTALTRELAPALAVRHEVREDLFARALADGRVTEATAHSVHVVVQQLIASGARVVVCTCSTLGNAAEQTPRVADVAVLRIDRPMAELAASLGRPVLVAAATPTATATALSLLNTAFHEHRKPPEVRELDCSEAWRRFQVGDQLGYAATIAELVTRHARPNDVVMLAQASMAPAASLIHRTDIQMLTSPATGVRAAIAIHRAACS